MQLEHTETLQLDYELPEYPEIDPRYRRAPRRESHLSRADQALAIKNALRYIHPDHHAQMAKEFAQELAEHGRIYGYRFRPAGAIYGKPIDEYKGRCIEGRAIQVMIDNNLDFDVALYPYELTTYGETGQVCQNWMQYRLIKKYLEQLTEEQTLVVMSGHPLGLFHSHRLAPRVIISNGLMVGTFDDQENFNRAAALGVANYGQMTAGGWMYIGPQGLSFAERTRMLAEEPEAFRALVDKTLQHHYEMICKFHDRGTYFFDYGNSFLKAVYDSGVKAVCKNGENDLDGFVFPSYVEDILGPCLFDYGYGPFRWCCLSRKPEDLHKTDMAAAEYIRTHNRRYQDYDNYVWVRDAEKNRLVVGTQCRILYQDAMGRMNLALKFNEMVRNGEIGPVILGRDHHDTGGTDAPFRETSNIKDGSNLMAEMATQCYAGNAARGMSYIALHNGGGTGIGRAINGGFGMVLDGSERVDTILRMAMPWDTMVGVARRSWACNEHAMTTAAEYNELYAGQDHITMPYVADSAVVEQAVAQLEC